ncbi:phosphoinositide phospholipase C [Trichonephila inaurata madagascariensis]|uniref:Phosphoinositide phospholipase C n=1 Tax=Trichonephila inaurata madagascariensis TaxID=2747483 RepID=A0A8X6IRR9_9ARAC|nr:phosphoinositide phospholipase C [Trichonephila inaurata madagascariensis]
MSLEKVKVEMCCEAMPLQVIIKGMTMGTVMYKVRSPDRWYRRKYKVDIQNMRLTYAPSSKPFWKGKITTACKCGSFSRSGSNIGESGKITGSYEEPIRIYFTEL